MKKYAMLIDVENISDRYLKSIFSNVSVKHQLTYRRIYGDFTKPSLSAWKNLVLENSLTPMQQYSYTTGKNSTDSAMVIDAMDILYSGNVDGFYIISSDSDFTKLATRLRESGMDVIGMGEGKTPQSFRCACKKFVILDSFARSEDNVIQNSVVSPEEKPKKTKETKQQEVKKEVVKEDKKKATKKDNLQTERQKFDEFVKCKVIELAKEDGKCDVSPLGKAIKDNGYSVKKFGYAQVIKYLKDTNIFEVDYIQNSTGTKFYSVKVAKK